MFFFDRRGRNAESNIVIRDCKGSITFSDMQARMVVIARVKLFLEEDGYDRYECDTYRSQGL